MKTSLKLISGDASDRKFYREFLTNQNDTSICMQFPSWDSNYGGDPINWLGMQSALAEMHIPVPNVYKVDPQTCTIWTEDLGDQCLSSVIKSEILDLNNPLCTEALDYYKKALQLIIQAQYPEKHVQHPALNKFFDFDKLYYEMLFFIKHFLNHFLNLSISEETHNDLYADFKNLCRQLEGYEHVLCHRDYHVRNIMLKNNHIYWIDFQDARMGPHSYDVVSLLRDSYVNITWETRKYLFSYYFEELNRKRSELKLDPMPKEKFCREILLMGLQRNLKAIGSFAYLAIEKQKKDYLKYIFYTLETICSGDALLNKDINLNLIAEFPYLFKLLLELQSGELTHKLEKKIHEFQKSSQ